MKKVLSSAVLMTLLFVWGCGSSEENRIGDSLEWELEIVDSIQVDYLADIREGTFAEGFGVIKDLMSTTLVKFDSTGKIITRKEYPKEGPGSITFLSTIHFHEGKYYGLSSFSGIYRLDSNLELLEKIEMPFLGEGRGGPYNGKNIKIWQNKILMWYPGREGISPYLDYFYRDYPLLELYDLQTGTSKSVVRIPPTSKFSSDDFFGRPYLNFTIAKDSLYLTLSNEPLVHVYTMGDSIIWERSMEFNPSEFQLIQGQKKPVTYTQMMQLHEGSIEAIYSDPSHLIVYYKGGIDSETFQANELKERKNFSRYPEFEKAFLRIYNSLGWSNEIRLPSQIGPILNIESTDKEFYALRNDVFLGEEQEYLTFYKLRLVSK
jgi:hypothetical protein